MHSEYLKGRLQGKYLDPSKMNAWDCGKQGKNNVKFIKSLYNDKVTLKEYHKKLQQLQWKEQGKVKSKYKMERRS
jgi:hypothetical protein